MRVSREAARSKSLPELPYMPGNICEDYVCVSSGPGSPKIALLLVSEALNSSETTQKA
jgi:hypothetical protein